jgi:putative transposase
MPNHVHLILVFADATGLGLALARAHRLYAGFVNARARQTGHLFQGRLARWRWTSASDGRIAQSRAEPRKGALVARAQDWPIQASARNFRAETMRS